jgi:hypothetical protein
VPKGPQGQKRPADTVARDQIDLVQTAQHGDAAFMCDLAKKRQH